ncbi:MAG: TAXI family TRAP transporter solute-binding subunit [Nitrospinota bacterium]
MKRIGQVFLIAALAAGLAAGTATAQKKQLSFATAKPGGSWFPVGAGMSGMLNKYVPGIEVKTEQTGGTLHNNKLVGKGEADFGISVARVAWLATKGLGPFKKGGPLKGVTRWLGRFTTGVLQIATLKGSGLKSICDMKGKVVSLGPAGGGASPAIAAAFGACGFKKKDTRGSYLNYSQGKNALLDGKVVAATMYAAIPIPAMKELQASGRKFTLLTLGPKELERAVKKFKYEKVIVPGSAYGLPGEFPTIGAGNIFIVNKDVPEDIVYRATKAIMDHLEEFKAIHPSLKHITPKVMADVPQPAIPWHPGALRYFKEKKLL